MATSLIIERDYYNDVRDCYNRKGKDYSINYIGWVGFMGSYNGRFSMVGTPVMQ